MIITTSVHFCDDEIHPPPVGKVTEEKRGGGESSGGDIPWALFGVIPQNFTAKDMVISTDDDETETSETHARTKKSDPPFVNSSGSLSTLKRTSHRELVRLFCSHRDLRTSIHFLSMFCNLFGEEEEEEEAEVEEMTSIITEYFRESGHDIISIVNAGAPVHFIRAVLHDDVRTRASFSEIESCLYMSEKQNKHDTVDVLLTYCRRFFPDKHDAICTSLFYRALFFRRFDMMNVIQTHSDQRSQTDVCIEVALKRDDRHVIRWISETFFNEMDENKKRQVFSKFVTRIVYDAGINYAPSAVTVLAKLGALPDQHTVETAVTMSISASDKMKTSEHLCARRARYDRIFDLMIRTLYEFGNGFESGEYSRRKECVRPVRNLFTYAAKSMSASSELFALLRLQEFFSKAFCVPYREALTQACKSKNTKAMKMLCHHYVDHTDTNNDDVIRVFYSPELLRTAHADRDPDVMQLLTTGYQGACDLYGNVHLLFPQPAKRLKRNVVS